MLCNKHKSNNYGTSLYKEASEIVELKSKRTIGNTNCVIGSSNNKKQHDDVSYLNGLTWMICPKCSKDTTRFARFERKVKRMLSVENVVKMFVRLKVNEKAVTLGYGEGWGVQQQQQVGTGVTCLGNYNGNNKVHGNNTNNVVLKKKKTGQSWKWLSSNIQQQRGNNTNTNLAMQDDVNTRKNSESIKMHPINFNVKAIQKADINFET